MLVSLRASSLPPLKPSSPTTSPVQPIIAISPIFRVFIAHPMSFDINNKHSSFIGKFYFMNRGRLWCSRRILFRHWT
ncbi:hypothetical protein L3X38_041456 [Prunus dulcis]|uniref:Uncharacterized protein n=1 Tax=Prunus dulcis TaxID=3755 RepID=A0AAD4UU19_PRUDU|nr:hypothetical protein L3X38_041456 [Prunus dulcis]